MIIGANWTLCQLKRDGNVRCQIYGLAIACGWAKTNLRSYAAGLFVQPMTQPVNDVLDDHLSGSGKGHAQNHITLNPELSRLRRILHRRF